MDRVCPSTVVNNPRSVTTTRTAQGRRVFCKTSDLSLGLEARILAHEAQEGRGAVRAIPFVSYDGERNELVTEFVPHDNLFNVLWNGTSRFTISPQAATARKLVRGVSSWLAAFHLRSRRYSDAAGTIADHVNAGMVQAAVERKLDRLAAVLSRNSAEIAFIVRLRRLARSLVPAPAWAHLQVSLIHGDFSTGNVMVAEDGHVFVGDFTDARPGFVLEDVVRFWSSIWELAECGQRRRAVFDPVLRDILSLNDLPQSVQYSPPFILMREWNSVTKLLEVESLRGRLGLATTLVLRRIARVHRQWLETMSRGFDWRE